MLFFAFGKFLQFAGILRISKSNFFQCLGLHPILLRLYSHNLLNLEPPLKNPMHRPACGYRMTKRRIIKHAFTDTVYARKPGVHQD